MLKTIMQLDPSVAAGVLAQTAMHLEHSDEITDHSGPFDPGLEQSILEELRLELNIPENDWSENTIYRLVEALDVQSDILFDTTNGVSNLERLSAQGLLSSELYSISFRPGVSQSFEWRWNIESILATYTVKNPHKEQLIGLRDVAEGNPSITIFSRFFSHKYPAKSFWMLVVGQRNGERFTIAQVWRIYPAEINLSECRDLLDVLKAFAERYGHVSQLNGIKGKFFFKAKAPESGRLDDVLQIFPKRGHRIEVSTLESLGNSKPHYYFLIVSVDISVYHKSVEHWKGWDPNLLSDLDNGIIAASTLSKPETPDALVPRP